MTTTRKDEEVCSRLLRLAEGDWCVQRDVVVQVACAVARLETDFERLRVEVEKFVQLTRVRRERVEDYWAVVRDLPDYRYSMTTTDAAGNAVSEDAAPDTAPPKAS